MTVRPSNAVLRLHPLKTNTAHSFTIPPDKSDRQTSWPASSQLWWNLHLQCFNSEKNRNYLYGLSQSLKVPISLFSQKVSHSSNAFFWLTLSSVGFKKKNPLFHLKATKLNGIWLHVVLSKSQPSIKQLLMRQKHLESSLNFSVTFMLEGSKDRNIYFLYLIMY